jgi:folylpolyglutamate synthase/dihydropteroate synthase
VVPEVAQALDRAASVTPAHGVVVVTGSLYLVGAARSVLNGTTGEPLDRAVGPAGAGTD